MHVPAPVATGMIFNTVLIPYHSKDSKAMQCNAQSSELGVYAENRKNDTTCQGSLTAAVADYLSPTARP